MLSRRETSGVRERGSALIAAIALLVLSAFVVVAIVLSSYMSRDSMREGVEATAAELLARDAGTMLAASYSAMVAGEHTGFAPTQAVLQQHASKLPGGAVVPIGSLGSGLDQVDGAGVPGYARYAVSRDLGDGRIGFWQPFSIQVPRWGEQAGGETIDPAGAVDAYVRVWTQAEGGGEVTQPMIYRLELRPQWFADYQMLFDGPVLIGANATINGRVHSNGFSSSYFNQYAAAGYQIKVDGSCTGAAAVSTSTGSIVGAGAGCNPREDVGARINLLRARDHIGRLRAYCGGGMTTISLWCGSATTPINVTLSGTSVIADGRRIDARVTGGGRPGGNQGAVIIASGDIYLSGTLSSRARATIIAAAPPGSATFGEEDGAPAVWVTSGGTLGSSTDATSSVGVIAEGDIIFDETRACGVTVRGAYLSLTGMMSIHPTWRVPIPTPGAFRCPATFDFQGSIAAHYAPLMNQDGNAAGYSSRSYSYHVPLFDNPPPLYPTAGDWELTRAEPANLDCFSGQSLEITRQECA